MCAISQSASQLMVRPTSRQLSASGCPVFGRAKSIIPWLPASFHFPQNIVAFMKQYAAKGFITWIVVSTSSRTYKYRIMEVSVTPFLQFILWLELIRYSVGSINTPHRNQMYSVFRLSLITIWELWKWWGESEAERLKEWRDRIKDRAVWTQKMHMLSSQTMLSPQPLLGL